MPLVNLLLWMTLLLTALLVWQLLSVYENHEDKARREYAAVYHAVKKPIQANRMSKQSYKELEITVGFMNVGRAGADATVSQNPVELFQITRKMDDTYSADQKKAVNHDCHYCA